MFARLIIRLTVPEVKRKEKKMKRIIVIVVVVVALFAATIVFASAAGQSSLVNATGYGFSGGKVAPKS